MLNIIIIGIIIINIIIINKVVLLHAYTLCYKAKIQTFFFFSERALQPPPASQVPPPPPPASMSPTSDSTKHPNRRSRKSERPLPTKALPASSVTGNETSSTPSTPKADSEHVSTLDKGIIPRNDENCMDVTSNSAVSDASAKDLVEDKIEKDEKSLPSQLPPASDQKLTLEVSSPSLTGAGASSTSAYIAAASRVPPGECTEGLPALVPGRVSLHVSLLLLVHLFSFFSFPSYTCLYY